MMQHILGADFLLPFGYSKNVRFSHEMSVVNDHLRHFPHTRRENNEIR